MSIKTLTSVAVVALASCVAPIEEWTRTEYGTYGMRNTTPAASSSSGVVDAPLPGSVTEGVPSHDVEPSSSGRMRILELYQSGIVERDALKVETAVLTKSLEHAEMEIGRLSKMLADSEAQGSALREEHTRLLTETEELTSRLVTAQIRRLEAEKLLLESKLEWHRSGPMVVEAGSEGESRGTTASSEPMTKGTP